MEGGKRVKRGHSAGEYQNNLKHGVSNAFQESYYNGGESRRLWLEYAGIDEKKNKHMCFCKWCQKAVACHAGTIDQHEACDKHQAALRAHRAKEAAKEQWNRGVEEAKRQRQEKREAAANDPAKRTQFVAILRLLLKGRPITDYLLEREYLAEVQAPHIADMHWSVAAAWDMVEGINTVLCREMQGQLQQARFFAVSLDESTAVDNTGYLCCHIYCLDKKWRRQPWFLGLIKWRERDGRAR